MRKDLRDVILMLAAVGVILAVVAVLPDQPCRDHGPTIGGVIRIAGCR